MGQLLQNFDVFDLWKIERGDLEDFTKFVLRMRLKKMNVIDGGVEYIAGKTKDGNPKTIRVPLNKIGLEILEKYKNYFGEDNNYNPALFPFISEQKYSAAIKKMLELAGINRIVTIMDSKTTKTDL